VINPDDMPHIDALTEELINMIADKIAESGEDFPCVIFLLWVKLVHALVFGGWTKKELVDNVIFHADNETTKDTA
jgi:hypothetical protein